MRNRTLLLCILSSFKGRYISSLHLNVSRSVEGKMKLLESPVEFSGQWNKGTTFSLHLIEQQNTFCKMFSMRLKNKWNDTNHSIEVSPMALWHERSYWSKYAQVSLHFAYCGSGVSMCAALPIFVIVFFFFFRTVALFVLFVQCLIVTLVIIFRHMCQIEKTLLNCKDLDESNC